MVLRGKLRGRVGHCREYFSKPAHRTMERAFLLTGNWRHRRARPLEPASPRTNDSADSHAALKGGLYPTPSTPDRATGPRAPSSEPPTRLEREDEETAPRGNGHMLLAVHEERHRTRANRAAGLKLPERLASSSHPTRRSSLHWNRRRPARPPWPVTPAHGGDGRRKSHARRPVFTSSARTAPHASSVSAFSLPPV